jgi:hypothetical protein
MFDEPRITSSEEYCFQFLMLSKLRSSN